MNRLIHSSKFWAAVLDAFAATLAIVLTWFLAPEKVAEMLALVAIWQPVVLAVIVGNWKEDVAKYEAEATKAMYSRYLKDDCEETPK